MVCQQWASVVGLFLDIAGFLLIVFEWRMAFDLDEHPTSDGTRWDDAYIQYVRPLREWFVKFGVILVVLGFLLQAVGSWPGDLPALLRVLARSC